LLILFAFLLVSCHRYSFFSETDLSTAHISKGLQISNRDQIDSTYNFITRIINSYQKTIQAHNVSIKFYDSFSLIKNNKISANYYMSTSREFLIEIFKANESRFTIYGSRYPVQLYIYRGFDPEIGMVFNQHLDDFYKTYDTMRTGFNIYGPGNIYMDGFFKGDSNGFRAIYRNKFMHVDSTQLFWIRGLELVGVSENKDTTRKIISLKGIALMSGVSKVEKWIYMAENVGSTIANEEIQHLWINSEYFRTILANDRLAPFANSILIKIAHANESQGYNYDSSQFLRDKQIIKNKIDSFHISITADAMFSDLLPKIRTGTLLWFYSRYKGFEIQWILINIVYFLAVVLLILTRVIDKLKEPVNKKGLMVALCSINGWCFAKLPRGMDWKYWIIPGIVILLTYYVLFYLKAKRQDV